MSNSTVRDLLLDQHAHLHDLFDEVLEAARAGLDRRRIEELWRRFDHALLVHLDAEERDLLPVLRARHPDEVRALEVEHAQIRADLDRLDVAVQLHVLREPQVKAFIALLKAHAAREGASAYVWAEQELQPRQRRSLLGRWAA